MSKIFKNPLILALLSYFACMYELDTYKNYNGYHFLFVIAFLGIFYLFSKFSHQDYSKINKPALITSVILSPLLIIGRTVTKYEYLPTANLFTINSIIFNFVFILCLIPLFYVLLTYLFNYLAHIKLTNEPLKFKHFKLFTFICIFLGKIPYLLSFYPGIMTIDSLNIINMVEKHILYNHHPLVFTSFFGVIYKLGKFLFGSGNSGICFYILVQITIISLILTLLISFLNNKGINKKIICFLIIYFSLSPDFGYMSVTLWKDVLFGFSFVLFLLSYLKLFENDFKLENNIFFYLLFILSSLMLLFFRNNGIYIYFVTTVFFFIFLFKKAKVIPLTSLCLVVTYFFITGPVYNVLNVEPGKSVESYSVLLEQIGRVYVKDGNIPTSSKQYFSKLLDTSKIKANYTTWIADPMKNLTDNTYLEQTKPEFFKHWFLTFLNNPQTYVEAFLSANVGYWYPDITYISVRESSKDVAPNYDVTKYGIKTKSLLPESLTKVIRMSTSKSIPLSLIIWSLGFSFFLLIISLASSLYLKVKKEVLLIYVPLFTLWLTNVIASPVFNEYRYMYGLVLCNTLLTFIPLIYQKKGRKI